jgi:NAD(P)H-hydrate epimerase
MINEPRIITKNMVMQALPRRRADSHKGDFGEVLVVAGSVGMAGAALLCSGAALRGGAGLVRVCVPRELFPVIHTGVPEATCISREDFTGGARFDAVAIGPGLGMDDDGARLVKNILDIHDVKLIFDADALNIIAARGLTAPAGNSIITPHPGEAGRLLGISAAEVNANRVSAARMLAEKYGATCLLKGKDTVVATHGGGTYINPTGNAGMATAGSGDVLTGLILALSGQGLDAENAAVAGAYLHGLAGDIAAEEKGVHGLIASDIREAIPYAIKAVIAIDAQ